MDEAEIRRRFTKELHSRAVGNFRRRPVITNYNNDTWSIDLLDISRYATKNKNITFLLVVIDNFSRYLWVLPLKNKSGETVLTAFKSVVESAKNTPENLWSDEGTEFHNSEFKAYCTKHNINLYHTYSGLKAVYAERVNRTIRQKINDYMTEFKTENYIGQLPVIVKEYNDHVHRMTKATPKSVYYGATIPNIPTYIVDDYNPKFSVGDYVRLSVVKNTFEKGTTENYSREVYKITGIDNSQSPINYSLEDLKQEEMTGKFYENELIKSELPEFKEFGEVIKQKTENRIKKYLVRYKGWANKWDEWKTEAEVKAMGGSIGKRRKKKKNKDD
jgi:hypothetical protein